MAGRPKGSTNKPFRGALDRAIKQGDPERLRDIAEKLLDAAAAGEAWAIKELGDRLDGKPPQSTEITGNPDNPLITKVVQEIVDPKNKGSS